MARSRAATSASDRAQRPFIWATVAVSVLSMLGIAAILLGVPNPFSRERVATEEALNFWIGPGAAMRDAMNDVMAEASFAALRGDDCMPGGGEDPAVCAELAARLADRAVRLQALIEEARGLEVSASDPTIGAWVGALTAEREADVAAIRRLAEVGQAGFPVVGWTSARQGFNTNPLRGSADVALAEMLPNRVDYTPQGGE